MRYLLLIGLGLAFLSSACGKPNLIYIVDIRPVVAAIVDETTSNADPFATTPTVDTNQTWCVNQEDEAICFREPYPAHWALIDVANDRVPDERNPLLGQESFRGYALELSAEETGSPELAGHTGVLRGVLPPGEVSTFQVLLADFTTKATYAASRIPRPTRYSANYNLETSSGIDLRAAVTVLIGPFDSCPAGSYAATTCPAIFLP